VLDYALPFQLGHPLAFESGIEDRDHARGARPCVLPTADRSLSTALKTFSPINAIGQGTRTRLIGERGYNGVGFGGISVAGL
jgi:hypothetical protein